VSERLELLANGEVLARYYRHPSMLDHAVKAGASWEQIGARVSADRARQEHREWAEGQHDLWTGRFGGEPGRFGLDDAGCAEAIARAAEPDPPRRRPTRPSTGFCAPMLTTTARAPTGWSRGTSAPGRPGSECGRRPVHPLPRLRVHRAG
jgi:hypothetical protein